MVAPFLLLSPDIPLSSLLHDLVATMLMRSSHNARDLSSDHQLRMHRLLKKARFAHLGSQGGQPAAGMSWQSLVWSRDMAVPEWPQHRVQCRRDCDSISRQ